MRTRRFVNDSGPARLSQDVASYADGYRASWSTADYAAQVRALESHDIAARFGGDMQRAARAAATAAFRLIWSPPRISETEVRELVHTAARALYDQDSLDAEAIARKAMQIASEICVYTNGNIVIDFRSDLVSTETEDGTYPVFKNDRCLISKNKKLKINIKFKMD